MVVGPDGRDDGTAGRGGDAAAQGGARRGDKQAAGVPQNWVGPAPQRPPQPVPRNTGGQPRAPKPGEPPVGNTPDLNARKAVIPDMPTQRPRKPIPTPPVPPASMPAPKAVSPTVGDGAPPSAGDSGEDEEREPRVGLGRVRVVIGALALVATLSLIFAWAYVGDPTPTTSEGVAQAFVKALVEQDAEKAASFTTYPKAAERAIEQVFDGLGAQEAKFELTQFMDLGNSVSLFTMETSWIFGENKSWNYVVQGTLRNLDNGWRISWDPEVIAPDLDYERRIKYYRTDAEAPLLLDAVGDILMSEQLFSTVWINPETSPDLSATVREVAQAIKPIASLITYESMMKDIEANGGGRTKAVQLREQDFEWLGEDFNIPGVELERVPSLLTSDRRVRTPLVDAYRSVWQANRDATAGWAVVEEGDDGTLTPKAGYQGPKGPDIPTTLDAMINIAATEAVVYAGTPAAIIAIQPSTGAVLASTQNTAGDDKGPITFTGLREAGNTIDLVRRAAEMDGKDPWSGEDLEATGQRLGLARDYDILGLEHETVNFTGDGAPSVTPFGLAVLAASVAQGTPVAPKIVHDQPPAASTDADPLPAHITEALRNEMNEAVNGPDGLDELQGYDGLVGKTGRAGDDRYFYGYRGDFAFAVFVQDAEGGNIAVFMAQKFMNELAKAAQQAARGDGN